MSRVLVLGGGGFIGSTVCDLLLQNGFDLRVFERPRIPPYRSFRSNENVDWLNGDIQNNDDLRNALVGIDAVIHLVSSTLPRGSNEATIYDVQSNVVATLSLLEEMSKAGIGKLVFISSGGTVYGTPQYLPMDECHPTNPEVSYGITKLMIEKYLSLYERTRGIKSIVLRVSNPFGPRQRIETAQGAVGIFLHRALTKQSIQIWGDGSVVRDYVYVTDVAKAFVSALKYEGELRVFNVGSGVGLSLLDVLAQISKCLGHRPDIEFASKRAFDIPRSILNVNLASEHLKWAPEVKFEDGLIKTIDWFRKQI